MSQNPYEPTAAPQAVDVGGPGPATFKSTASLTNWVVGLLALTALATLMVGVADVAFEMSFDMASDATITALGTILFVCGIGGLLSYVVCGIVFLVWVHRTVSNAHALGGTLSSPGWAVGYWFIPLVNLFKPYQALREAYRVSFARKATGSIHSVDLPGIFPAWWTFWVLSSILGRIESRLPRIEVDSGVVLVIGIASTFVTLAAAFFAIQVVRSTSRVQDEHDASVSGRSPEENPFAR